MMFDLIFETPVFFIAVYVIIYIAISKDIDGGSRLFYAALGTLIISLGAWIGLSMITLGRIQVPSFLTEINWKDILRHLRIGG